MWTPIHTDPQAAPVLRRQPPLEDAAAELDAEINKAGEVRVGDVEHAALLLLLGLDADPLGRDRPRLRA